MSSILKLFSRFIGKTLISTSLTFFILTFFAIPLAENVGVITESIDAEVLLEDVMENSDITLEEARTLCNKNPSLEECEIIENPKVLLEEQLKPVMETAEEIKPVLLAGRWISIIIFILGIGLLYLGTFNIYETAYKTSITTFFTSLIYSIFYKLSGNIIPSIAQNLASGNKEVPQALLDMAVKAIQNWIQIPINEVFTLCLILMGISLPIAIASYILKNKQQKGTKKSEK
ncbi:hypothetical protein J4442_05105 [Candidatus Woesearchaeota archaeon]|nr:hypothetical protein [Candidatus Woesearchaeota archaeon]